MKMNRVYAGLAGALVAGIILGSASSVMAAPAAGDTPSTGVIAACEGLGLRMGAAIRDGGGRLLDVVADLTGKSTEDVTAERQAGKTFTQIASESGVSQQAVIDEALKLRKELLDAKVTDGTISQEQADTALENMQTRLTERIDTVNTDCGAGGMGGGGRGMGGGGMGMGRGATSTN